MKKRLPTSIFILIFTIGFVLLRQFSLLFFDAFALIMMLGSVIEVVRVQKKQNKKIDAWLLYAVPLALFAIFAFAKGKLVFLFISECRVSSTMSKLQEREREKSPNNYDLLGILRMKRVPSL